MASSSSPLDGDHFKTESPSSQEVLAEVSMAGPADVDRAVQAARRAHEEVWGPMPGKERAKYIFRVARIIQERARELAVLESLDNGKPIKESRDVDIPLAAAHFFYHAGWADKLAYAGLGPHPKPLGVAGQVIPWNFPLLMAAWKLAPALATGNTCVLKPAETTPLSALLLAEILQQAELPPGVVNIITGRRGDRRRAGRPTRESTRSPLRAPPRWESKSSAVWPAPVSGSRWSSAGKAANIVFDDAPALPGSRGHRQRHLLQPGPRVLRRFPLARPGTDRRGPGRGAANGGSRPCAWATPSTRTPTSAPSTPHSSSTRSASWLSPARPRVPSAGRPPARCLTRGYWFPPTLFTGVVPAQRIAREEIFGPVLSVLTFRTPDEAIEKANNTTYGLSAGVWTEKGSRILHMAARLRAGVVWANTFNRFDPSSPFGGYRESGFGREGGPSRPGRLPRGLPMPDGPMPDGSVA